MIACQQNEVEVWLKVSSFFFKGTTKLIILDDYAALKDMKGRTSKLVSLGFSARHTGISVWGAYLADRQHREALPGNRRSDSSFLHILEQNRKGHAHLL